MAESKDGLKCGEAHGRESGMESGRDVGGESGRDVGEDVGGENNLETGGKRGLKKLTLVQLLFLGVGMLTCLVPFVGMAFHPTEDSTENKTPAAFPSVNAKDGGLNTKFFEEFDAWFNEHFAFRNELVAADAYVQGTLFKTSAEEQVIYGTDGWLYYSSTLGDYLGTNCMTERELFNLKHNLKIVTDWAKDRGVTLVLTVPPNKNTLYGEHMPYYASTIVKNEHTMDFLPVICEEIGLPYADLYALFRNQSEELYLKRDSHWNGKGALLAYNRIMETADQAMPDGYTEHAWDDSMHPDHWSYEDYQSAPAIRAKDADGDLNRMLYTFFGEKEMDTHYDVKPEFSYTTETESVEDAWICTKNPEKERSLVMFRDSFGNTLLPYIADQFQTACFTRESPYRLQKLVEEQKPKLVILEKVERNLKDYITQPPILSAPEVDISSELPSKEPVDGKRPELTAEASVYDPSMIRISGVIPEDILSTETEIVLSVDGTGRKVYHTGSNGFMVYLDSSELSGGTCKVQVLLKDGVAYRMICETELSY